MNSQSNRPHHVVDDGAPDETVVLLNGLGTSLAMWDGLVPDLLRHASVVRLDLPGHGGTPAASGADTMADLGHAVLELLDVLQVERAHLVGCSLGGMIAQWIAVHRPDRVDRMVLIATAGKLGTPQAWAERADLALSEGMARMAEVVVPRWFTDAFQHRHPDRVEGVVKMLAACDPAGYAACCRAIGGNDLRADLHHVTAATLVLVGSEDPVVPVATAQGLADALPDGRLTVVPSTAHLLPVEDATAAAALVVDHLFPDHGGIA